ncbi:hypothetical protein [Rheinheimera sp.]|nr:hypothetical protein [Rheinheimera sp.]MDP2714341.1 hypothetical protein [Rheinheimera sp.]
MSYPLSARALRYLQQLQQRLCQQLKGLRQQNMQGMTLKLISIC